MSPNFYRPLVRPISLQVLRKEPQDAARRVRGGEELIVYRYSEPMFRLIRPYDNGRTRPDRLERPDRRTGARESIW